MLAHVAVAVLLAAALPAAVAQADEIQANADAELAEQVRIAIQQNTKPEDVNANLVSAGGRPIAQQFSLFGGDQDYKPYAVACPAATTWVRSANDVSEVKVRSADSRALAKARKTTLPSGSRASTRRSSR